MPYNKGIGIYSKSYKMRNKSKMELSVEVLLKIEKIEYISEILSIIISIIILISMCSLILFELFQKV